MSGPKLPRKKPRGGQEEFALRHNARQVAEAERARRNSATWG